jgi:dihydroxyacetone kinase-like protein
VQDLKNRGAVGSINLRYFNARGEPVRSPIDDCTVGLTLGELKKVRRVIGVAGGPQKLKAIQAALEGGLVDVLVTDHATAHKLAEAPGSKPPRR